MRICGALLVADMHFHIIGPLRLGEVVENKPAAAVCAQ